MEGQAPVAGEGLQAVLANNVGRLAGDRSLRIAVEPEPSTLQSIAEVLRAHVNLKIEGMLAGGYTYRAKWDYVRISRAGDSEKKKQRVDLNALVYPGGCYRSTRAIILSN